MRRISQRADEARSGLDRPDPRDFLSLVEARDFLRVHLPKLTQKQRSTIMAWAGGTALRDIAAAEGITRQSAAQRLKDGLTRLRLLAGEGGKDDTTGSAAHIPDL